MPWRLRKISTGDVVPEVIPLGLFTWSIESIPNRLARSANGNRNGGEGGQQQQQDKGKFAVPQARNNNGEDEKKDKYQVAAERSFQKQKAYFSDPKRVPYPLQVIARTHTLLPYSLLYPLQVLVLEGL